MREATKHIIVGGFAGLDEKQSGTTEDRIRRPVTILRIEWAQVYSICRLMERGVTHEGTTVRYREVTGGKLGLIGNIAESVKVLYVCFYVVEQ